MMLYLQSIPPKEVASRDPPTIPQEIAERLSDSLIKIKDFMSDASNDDGYLLDFLSCKHYPEALTKAEIVVGLVALHMEKNGSNTTYSDVLRVTDEVSGKAMSTGMVYKTIERLVEREIFCEVDMIDPQKNTRAKAYRVIGDGREAIRLAVQNAKLLANSNRAVAA